MFSGVWLSSLFSWVTCEPLIFAFQEDTYLLNVDLIKEKNLPLKNKYTQISSPVGKLVRGFVSF